jgi:prevent-host-death family protein
MMKRIAVTQLRHTFGSILDQASRRRTRFLITRHGVPMVLILGIADFKDILKKQLKVRALRREDTYH